MMNWFDSDEATDQRGSGVSDSALEILNRRYPLGGIDRSEYEEKKKAMTRIKE